MVNTAITRGTLTGLCLFIWGYYARDLSFWVTARIGIEVKTFLNPNP